LEGLSFSEKKKRSRPPFSVPWITGKLLKVGALAGMNSEARAIFLTLIETGARLSEICNLTSENIVLNGDALIRRLVRVEYIRRPIWKDEKI